MQMETHFLFSTEPSIQLESLNFYVRFLASVYRLKYSSSFTTQESFAELMIDNDGQES